MAGGDKRAKVRMVQAADDESSDDSAAEAAPQLPQRKKQKAVVRKTKGAVRLAKAEPQSADTAQKANRQRAQHGAPPRGRAPGGGELEPGEDEEDDWRVEDPTFSQYPELARELRIADAVCERYFGEAAEREVEDGDEQVVQSGGSAAVRDGDAATVEAAASVYLDDELAGRDEERALRYVATVRPAMAALRSVRPSSADNEQPRQDGGQRQETEEGGSFPTSSDGLRTEEGGDPGAVGGKPGVVDVGNLETRSAVPESEEGVTPSVNGDVSVASGAELSGKGDGKAVDMHGIASVRRVAKQRKRAAKRRRAANAEHRKHEAVTDAQDVEAAVAALDSEQRARREQQRGEAREGLTRRRQQQGGVRQPEDGLVAKMGCRRQPWTWRASDCP
ncbi:hypothetical protein PF003_g2492 [Phytophthora fragariae]|nr:hypothetical protein PF003_g2492 [Phytophthora fragariae]